MFILEVNPYFTMRKMSKLSIGVIVIVVLLLAAVFYVLFAQSGPCAYLQKGYRNIETGKCENFSTCGNIPSKYIFDSNCADKAAVTLTKEYVLSQIDVANYCDSNLDCANVGGHMDISGCDVFVNKNEVQQINALMSTFDHNAPLNMCGVSWGATCISHKCVRNNPSQ